MTSDEFAEIFAAEDGLAHRGAFAGQEFHADARAVVRGGFDDFPVFGAVELGFVDEAALRSGGAHDPERSV